MKLKEVSRFSSAKQRQGNAELFFCYLKCAARPN